MTIPTRKNSLRYQGFDYSSPAGVFVTIVTHGRQPLFGEIENGEIQHTLAGEQVVARWSSIPDRFSSTFIDAYMVMPDHVHGILWMGAAQADNTPTTGDVVRWLKTTLLADYTQGVSNLGWEPYAGRLWQRGYHDHIIRGERDLRAIRDYIGANPAICRKRKS